MNNGEERELTAYPLIPKLGESTVEQIQPASAPETSRYNVGKVRQLFEERRKQTAKRKPSSRADFLRPSVVGRDKSYPLQPLRRAADPAVAQIIADHPQNYDLRFDEIDSPAHQRKADLIKVSSWPTIACPFDPSIFGKLPNLGGKLLSERTKVEVDTENYTGRFAPTGAMSSRIPTKISTLTPVAKITDGVARLSTNSSRTVNSSYGVTRKQPTVQKNFLSPVRITQTVAASQRKLAPPVAPNRQGSTNRVPEAPKTALNGKSTPTTATPKSVTSSNLPTCKICGRHFAADRIVRHQEICEKSTKRKRKVFDPVKHRLKGTEAEGLINKIKSTTKKVQPVKKSNWRQQHEEFLENIREARKVKQHLAKGGKLSDLPPPKPLDTSDYVQCPHCNRKFNESAAQRHVPKCANMRHNKPKNPTSQATTPAAAAKLSRATKINPTRKR